MPGLSLALPDGRRVAITAHLLDRWQEQVCPLASRAAAAQLLDRCLELAGTVEPDAPGWVQTGHEHEGAGELACWVVFGDYAIPVLEDGRRLYAPTIIARGALTTALRWQRRVDGRVRRHRRSAPKRASITARSGDRRRRREQLAPRPDDHEPG